MRTGAVPVAAIRTTLDAGLTQVRAEHDEATVERYAEAMKRRAKFPPVELVEDGRGKFLIADGWHRVFAARQAGAKRIPARLMPVLDGLTPRLSALRYALRANTAHGLPLKSGDERNKARRAILEVPPMATMGVRALAREICVSPATVSRARNDLVREGLIPHAVTGELRDEVQPDEYASSSAFRAAFHDLETYYAARDYVRQLKALRPRDWSFEEGRVRHRGLVPDATVEFAIDGNPVVEGLPTEWQRVEEDDDDEAAAFQPMTEDKRQMLARMNARREFNEALERVKAHNRRDLTAAAMTLKKYRRVPGLWEDLQALVNAGGPPQETLNDDF